MPSLWAATLKNEQGVFLDFTKRKFLVDIYNDLSPHQVLLKPPQIGATVMHTLKSMWVAKRMGRQIIYTLPTQSDVQDMVGGAINRIIAQNAVLMDWVKDHDTVEQKTVGDSAIFYRGTFTQKQAMMIPSGLNIHDEVDASDAQVITQYETRLQAQEDGGWRWYFSHPSLAGHGVDIYWQDSDQKEWYITCNDGHQQTLTWPDSIRTDGTGGARYVCKHCGIELTTENRVNGAWLNKDGVVWTGEIAGDYRFSGWHVSQLMLYNKSAQDIVDAFNDPLKDQQYFYNYVLGLPYVGSDDRIDPKVVLRNCVDQINSQEFAPVIGADTGHGIHYVLMNKEGVFFYEHLNEITASKSPYDVIRSYLKRWDKAHAFFDQGGDLIGVRQLQQEFPGRVFLVFYNKDRKTLEPIVWGENEEYGKVRVDRNRMMTLVVEQLRDIGRVRLNGTPEEWTEFASHFGYLYREQMLIKETRGKDDRSLYGAEYVWKRNGPDHFAHALLYAMVGMQRYGGDAARIVGESALEGIPRGQVVTPQKEASIIGSIPAGEFSSENRVW